MSETQRYQKTRSGLYTERPRSSEGNGNCDVRQAPVSGS